MKVNKEKAKVVLVNSNLDVVILKELEKGKEDKYEGNVNFRCGVCRNKIKAVGNNYMGEIKIIQNNKVLFIENSRLFDDNFPFGLKDK